MFQRTLAALREAEDAPRIQDAAQVETLYRKRRNQVLLASMIGYGLFYFCRNDLSASVKLLKEDLHITDAGKIGTALFWSYGLCKFLTGLVADRASPRTLMVGGLVLSALLNVIFGCSSQLWVLIAIWGLNGVVQSFGAPASAKIIAVWFGASERGTKTGIWNISHQGGGGLVLMFAGLCAQFFGWRGGMIIPALVALVGAVLVYPYLHDRPESEGLPPIEEWRPDQEVPETGESAARLILFGVLLNPRVILVALASGCLYFVRYGCLFYSAEYLAKVRNLSPAVAGSSASLLEFLGIPGALLCGWLSDRLGGRRAPVVLVSLVLLAASTSGLVRVPAGHPALDLLLLGAIGFFTYGPQMLLAGVAPIDMSNKRVAAAAVGFVGGVSYLSAGISTGYSDEIIKLYGYQGAFDFWSKGALTGAVLCIPMWLATTVRKK